MQPTPEIRVDAREALLLAHLPEASRVGLPVGDVAVGPFVIERKTGPDLAASVRDGRWRDQLARLVQLRQDEESAGRWMVPLVVVEGPLRDPRGMSEASLLSAVAGALVRDGIATMRTDGPRHTAEFVRCLADRLARAEEPSTQTGRASSGARRGEALREPRALALAQLRVVPGVSARIAEAVLGDHRSLGSWVRDWSGRRLELAAVRVGARRLGPTLAGRLLDVIGTTGAG